MKEKLSHKNLFYFILLKQTLSLTYIRRVIHFYKWVPLLKAPAASQMKGSLECFSLYQYAKSSGKT